MSNLVIVESPTKARTLSKYLGKKYRIEASMGHIRDLPKSELGVDVSQNFDPKYIIPKDKKKRVGELKKAAQVAKIIYLATDPDREGEAIAWHLEHLLHDNKSDKKEVKRVVFHEITESAIKSAFDHPRAIYQELVDAQQARRILDRLVGYKLSPILWKKVKRGLSAGRVQTVALRLIVEREREIEKFKPIEYWSIEIDVETDKGELFTITLVEKNQKKLEVNNQKDAKLHLLFLETAHYQIAKIIQKEVKRSSPPPFTTSTLQQTAGNKLGLTAKRTMMLAQNLYEHGFITYMRTDSVNLSTFALDQSREYISQNLGPAYLPKGPKVFKSKSKNAQEAHEAIRPTNLATKSDGLKGDFFTKDHKRLYDLIWKRTIASQVADAVLDQTTVDVLATQPNQSDNYTLKATGSILKFDGWLRIYGITQISDEEKPEGTPASDELTDDQDKAKTPKKQPLPQLTEQQLLNYVKAHPEQHFTQPPPRYTEASLIKKMEELGIGRPSTYAPILSTIQDRFYVEKKERKFVPTPLGSTTVDFLIKYFSDVFDYTFTANMEDYLDEISRGERKWQDTIKDFYTPFEKKLEGVQDSAEKVKLEIEYSDKICPLCGKQLAIRTGKYGKFLACSGFPDCKHTESIIEKLDIKCPQDGGEILLKKTRTGKPFYGCKNWPTCTFASWTKPK